MVKDNRFRPVTPVIGPNQKLGVPYCWLVPVYFNTITNDVLLVSFKLYSYKILGVMHRALHLMYCLIS